MNKTRLFGLRFDPKEALLAASVIVGIVCWFATFWPAGVLLTLALAIMLTADAPPKRDIADRSVSKLGLAVSAVILAAQIGPLVWLVRTLVEMARK